MTALIFLPSIAYAIVAEYLGFLAPRLNLDLLLIYLLCVVVATRAPRLAAALAIGGMTFALAVQLMLGVGAIYIDDPVLIREYVAFVEFWPWRLISFWTVIGAAFLLGLYFLIRRVNFARARIWPAVALFAILLLLDLAGRSAAGHAMVGGNLATSSTVRTLKLVRAWATTEPFSATPLERPMMVAEARSAMPSRIVSISVEALGLSLDPRFNSAMFAPMRKALGAGFVVEVGRHRFKGATLSGELRELCAYETAGTPTRADALALSGDCLPSILLDAGYRTLGVHGNSRYFYNRFEVYPALGFTETLFYDDFMNRPGRSPLCATRAFEGICDRTAVRAALAFVAERPRSFAHVMTLDTHFPLGETALGDADCGLVPGLDDADLCLYANQMSNLLAQIGEEIRSSPTPPDVIYIFGDHAPPFAVATERFSFDREHVPYVTITRR